MIEIIKQIIQGLNNRELSLLVWITLFGLFCLCHPKIRKHSLQVIKTFFAWKLTLSYILMFIYLTLIIWLLKTLSLWKTTHLSLTFVWCLSVGFVMLFNFQKANDPNFFKQSFKDNLRALVFLEFFVNLYVFNFWIEFLLVPIFALIGGIQAIIERDKQYAAVNKIINNILIIFGFSILLYASYKTITDFKNFVTVQNFESFYLPILLSLLFMPFIYIIALLSAYETFFIRLQFFVPEKSVLKYAKVKTLLSIKLNLWKLNSWSDYIIKNWRFKSKQEVNEAIARFRQTAILSNKNNDNGK